MELRMGKGEEKPADQLSGGKVETDNVEVPHKNESEINKEKISESTTESSLKEDEKQIKNL